MWWSAESGVGDALGGCCLISRVRDSWSLRARQIVNLQTIQPRLAVQGSIAYITHIEYMDLHIFKSKVTCDLYLSCATLNPDAVSSLRMDIRSQKRQILLPSYRRQKDKHIAMVRLYSANPLCSDQASAAPIRCHCR